MVTTRMGDRDVRASWLCARPQISPWSNPSVQTLQRVFRMRLKPQAPRINNNNSTTTNTPFYLFTYSLSSFVDPPASKTIHMFLAKI